MPPFCYDNGYSSIYLPNRFGHNSVDEIDLEWYKFSPIIKVSITKTCLYNFDTFKPHFYKVKLGFTGLYIFCLFMLKKT